MVGPTPRAEPNASLPRPAALLLTGGHSRRMGRDKAALVVDGATLAERTAALLGLVAAPVIEVGPGYTSLPRTREDPPGQGPLAAVAAGAALLHQLGHRGSTLIVATDLPRLTSAWLQLLAEHPAGADHCVVPRDAGGRPQPLCARYSLAALGHAPSLVAAGQRSMQALLQEEPVTWLDVDAGCDVLVDVDTPEDMAALNPLHHSERP